MHTGTWFSVACLWFTAAWSICSTIIASILRGRTIANPGSYLLSSITGCRTCRPVTPLSPASIDQFWLTKGLLYNVCHYLKTLFSFTKIIIFLQNAALHTSASQAKFVKLAYIIIVEFSVVALAAVCKLVYGANITFLVIIHEAFIIMAGCVWLRKVMFQSQSMSNFMCHYPASITCAVLPFINRYPKQLTWNISHYNIKH